MDNQNNNQANKQNQQMQKNQPWVKNMIFCILVISILAVLLYLTNANNKNIISYETFTEALGNNQIKQVEYSDKFIYILYNDGTVAYMGPANTELIQNSITNHNSTTDLNKVNQYAKIVSDSSWEIYVYLFLGGALILTFIFLLSRTINRSTKQSFDFTKNRALLIRSDIKFENVAGAEEEKEEVKEIVEFLKNPKKFTEMGARIPKGVILIGPPGTGKTLLAKAISGEANVPFFSISGSDFMELFVGVGASRVRDLFAQAKKACPCIVFIDEIDAIGRQRGTGLGGGNDEREQTLNQLLVQMDGFEPNEGIIVIAATNRADILDPALMRAGRFDRQIYINVPDVKGREEILKVHAKNKKIGKDVDFKQVARITSGFTGAELENLLNEAAINATKNGKKFITQNDITESIDKVTMGPQKRSRVVTERDKKITAYHESGHAIVGKLVPNSDPVHEISIVPRGNAAGYTVSRPETDDSHITKSKLEDLIVMMLAGRVAEKLFLDDITTGASNDIERATALAKKMVTEFGMSDKLGLMHMGSENSYFLGKDYMERNSYSENYANIIDTEINKILQRAESRATELLKDNKKIVENMVEVLLKVDTIYSNEVDLLMKKKSAKYVIEMIEKNKQIIEEEQKLAKEKQTRLKSNIIKNEAENTEVEVLPEKEISESFETALSENKRKQSNEKK